MELNKYDLFRALTEVDEELLAEAEQAPRKKQPLRYLVPLAASCACLALIILAVFSFGGRDAKSADSAALVNGTPETKAQLEARNDVSTFSPEVREDTLAPMALDPEGTAPVADTNGSYGASPMDFSFSITWPEGSYDSGSGLFTSPEGEIISKPLTAEELQRAWNLLCGLEMTEGGDGDLTLSVTRDGITQTMEVSLVDYGPALSICTELVRLVGGDLEE